MRRLMENVMMVLTFCLCFFLLYAVVTNISYAGKLGPTMTFRPLDGDAKVLVKQASMGFSEQPGFIKVSGVWYKIHWRFGDKRIEFHRTIAPSGVKTCMTWGGAPDDED